MPDFTQHISLDLSFEEIKLPPFQDVLIVGKHSPQGKIGLRKSFELMAPNDFKLIDCADDNVETVFISYHILKKIPEATLLNVLRERVFPFVSSNELVKVDLRLRIKINGIEISK
jgi:hypothetical protein